MIKAAAKFEGEGTAWREYEVSDFLLSDCRESRDSVTEEYSFPAEPDCSGGCELHSFVPTLPVAIEIKCAETGLCAGSSPLLYCWAVGFSLAFLFGPPLTLRVLPAVWSWATSAGCWTPSVPIEARPAEPTPAVGIALPSASGLVLVDRGAGSPPIQSVVSPSAPEADGQ